MCGIMWLLLLFAARMRRPMDEEEDEMEPMDQQDDGEDDEDDAPEQSMHRGAMRGSAVEAKNLPDLNDHHVCLLARLCVCVCVAARRTRFAAMPCVSLLGPPFPHTALVSQVSVVCNDVRGAFLVTRQQVVCNCTPCLRLPLRQRTFTPCQFERHAGSKAKKWKISIKLDADAAESLGLDHGDQPVTIGQYYDRRGIEVKPLYKKGGGGGGDFGLDDPSSTTCSGGSPADMGPSRYGFLWVFIV